MSLITPTSCDEGRPLAKNAFSSVSFGVVSQHWFSHLWSVGARKGALNGHVWYFPDHRLTPVETTRGCRVGSGQLFVREKNLGQATNKVQNISKIHLK
jgi:hypothetical protein